MSYTSLQVAVFEAGFLSILIFAAIVLLKFKVRWQWLVPIPVIAFASKLLLLVGVDGGYGDWLPDIPGRYNWEGKLVAIALSLCIIGIVFKGKRTTIGLTFRQDGPFRNIAFMIAVFLVIAWTAACLFKFQGVRSEPISDFLYQLTMPTIEEELWYRGILYAMLFQGFTPKNSQLPSKSAIILAALLISLSFWGAHSIGSDGEWGFIFDTMKNLTSLGFGMIFILVRIGTGSLVLPMILHSWVNTAPYIL